jgi:Ethanolamine ammonia-lyase heavy chain (EC 4.3.1.7)
MREWILSDQTSLEDIDAVRLGLNGEMVAAIAKLMSSMDLVLAAKKCPVIVKANTTLGMPGRLSARLQPNHPSDNVEGILASIYEGLSYGVGAAVIGINPVFDTADTVARLLDETAKLIDGLKIPRKTVFFLTFPHR